MKYNTNAQHITVEKVPSPFIMVSRNAVLMRTFTWHNGWLATLIIKISTIHGKKGKIQNSEEMEQTLLKSANDYVL